jgi:hypothetical protein
MAYNRRHSAKKMDGSRKRRIWTKQHSKNSGLTPAPGRLLHDCRD